MSIQQVLRTPEERFHNLQDYPFTPHYIHVSRHDGTTDFLRMHYIDEGPIHAPPILLLHGEPSWSYLYRTMIPTLVRAGHRVLAPDLIGFGKSDKPASQSDYSYQRHVDWVTDFVLHMKLTHITLFVQDWGGLIGLRIVASHPHLFRAVVAGNTFLPTGDGKPNDAFLAWQKYATTGKFLNIGKIMRASTVTGISDAVVAGYEAPFPDETYKAAAKKFPALVPTNTNDPATEPNRKAWQVLSRLQIPFLCLFSDSDPITRGADKHLIQRIPGTKGQPHTIIKDGGHFLQEDQGPVIAEHINEFIHQRFERGTIRAAL